MSAMAALTLGAAGLVAWHFALWPALLPRLARPRPAPEPVEDDALPAVALLVPAYNEARWIRDKVMNAAALDYPSDRLRLLLCLDGCTDDTRAQAEAALATPECAHLRCDIVENPCNLGKIATLNLRIPACPEPVVALSDASAALSLDALRRVAAHLADPRIGAVGGTYRVLADGAAGEGAFWEAQTAVKAAEAALGAPMGLHGAFYAIRRAAFSPLPPDTVNDDFEIPMRLVEDALRAAYDPAIVAVELEGTTRDMDFARRRRIGAGNLQMALRRWRLADPRRPGVALAFLSGKGLRPLMPLAMLAAFAGSLALAPGSLAFAALAAAQAAGYLSASMVALHPDARWPRAMRAAHYVAAAQVASALGALGWIAGRGRGPWGRVGGETAPKGE